MSTARNYLAREIYRSTLIVLIALLGFFTFFSLVEQLDAVSDTFPLTALFYLEALALPARLYELLPLGLLVGAILALAGLAQRNELTILRVSGMSSYRLLSMLWIIAVPVIVLALLLSEYITPMADAQYSEANLTLRGRVEGGRLVSGYWFKEPTSNGGERIINIGKLLPSGEVADLLIYDFNNNDNLVTLTSAPVGQLDGTQLILTDMTVNRLPDNAMDALAQGTPLRDPLMTLTDSSEGTLETTLTPARLVARILVPERMSLLSLWDYTRYMKANGLNTERQEIAIWRKLSYPLTLIVMLSIAAPIAYMQGRRGAVAVKIFAGILVGTIFFMVSQLSLNLGTLYRWNPVVTALLPITIAWILATFTIVSMERRLKPKGDIERRPPVAPGPAREAPDPKENIA